mgnify:CR=1 FL=1
MISAVVVNPPALRKLVAEGTQLRAFPRSDQLRSPGYPVWEPLVLKDGGTTDANGAYAFTGLTTNNSTTPANGSFGYKIRASLATATWAYVSPATSTSATFMRQMSRPRLRTPWASIIAFISS